MYVAWTKENILKPKFYVFLSEEDYIVGSRELGLLGKLEAKKIDPYNLTKLPSAILLGVKQINYDNEHGEITPYHIVSIEDLSYLAVRKVSSWFLKRQIIKENKIIYYTNPTVKVKSKTDVVTNSSSEVFIMKSDKSPENMELFLRSIKEEDNRVSGMGGIVEVYNNQTTKNDCNYWDWEDYESEASNIVDEHKPFECLPDGYLAIDLDSAFQEKRRWIMTNPDYIQCLDWPKHSPKNLFWGWLGDYWKKKWEEIQSRMANVKSDKEIQKIWPEYEKVERYYSSVQKCLEYEAKQT